MSKKQPALAVAEEAAKSDANEDLKEARERHVASLEASEKNLLSKLDKLKGSEHTVKPEMLRKSKTLTERRLRDVREHLRKARKA